MWLALPLTALRFWLVWDQLPARMATHFAADGQPNGWMSRTVAFEFAVGITAFILAVFTIIALVAHRQKSADKISWVLLAFGYVVVGIIFYANESVLAYNLNGQPVQVGPMLIAGLLAAVALTAVYLFRRRGTPLAETPAIATETHSSAVWAIVCLIPLAIELWIFNSVPQTGARVGLALLCVVSVLVAVFAWSGFQYRFTQAGVEISTLGFRLRSIPADQIERYEVSRWNLLRGYGIRGVGNCRAYVWGNKVVHIHTTHGDVFLGHNEPQRIVHDLDAMKQFAH